MQRVYSPLPDEFNQVMPLGPTAASPMGQMLRIIKGKHKTYFCLNRALILCFQHHLMNFYQVCSNYASIGQKWPRSGCHMYHVLRFYIMLVLST